MGSGGWGGGGSTPLLPPTITLTLIPSPRLSPSPIPPCCRTPGRTSSGARSPPSTGWRAPPWPGPGRGPGRGRAGASSGRMCPRAPAGSRRAGRPGPSQTRTGRRTGRSGREGVRPLTTRNRRRRRAGRRRRTGATFFKGLIEAFF